AVFDLGGGTFDISILELREGVFDVKATNGDTFLGGEDFDLAIVASPLKEFEKLGRKHLSRDRAVLQRLKEAARPAKHDLSPGAPTRSSGETLPARRRRPKSSPPPRRTSRR